MDRRKKLKLAVVSACAAASAVEQIIDLSPASFGLETRTLDRSELKHEQEDDDELNALFFQSSMLACSLALTVDSGWWVKPRVPAWFDKFVLEVNDRDSWFNALRMSKETFMWICNQLQPLLNRKVTRFRSPIPVPCRLGAALYRITSGADLQVISEKFGIGVSSSQSCITDTIKAINQHFGSRLTFPRGERLDQVVSGFINKCELVNCAGATGTTDVQVMSSSGLDITGCSISVQGISDTSHRFLDVYCGVSQEERRQGLLRAKNMLDSVSDESKYYLVGEEGYPLLSWLLVPYIESDIPLMADSFNRRHELGVLHVKESFTILKETFKILSKCVKHNVSFVPRIITACCVLHNILMERGEIDVENILRNSQGAADEDGSGADVGAAFADEDQGFELRDHLAEMFLHRDL